MEPCSVHCNDGWQIHLMRFFSFLMIAQDCWGSLNDFSFGISQFLWFVEKLGTTAFSWGTSLIMDVSWVRGRYLPQKKKMRLIRFGCDKVALDIRKRLLDIRKEQICGKNISSMMTSVWWNFHEKQERIDGHKLILAGQRAKAFTTNQPIDGQALLSVSAVYRNK